ncbi:MAG: GAF domain-containing protein, partial [Chloroflexi bacterium]
MNSGSLTINATNGAPDKQVRQLALFQEINQLVASNNSTEYIVQQSLNLMLDYLGYCAAQVYQLSTGGDDLWLYLEVGAGHKPVTQTGDIFSIDETNIISDSARQAELIYISNINTGPYSYYDSGDGVAGSEVAVPLRFGGELLGVLRVQAVNPNGFSPNDINYISGLTNLLATTIRNQRKINQLEDSIQEIKTLYKLQYLGNLEQQQMRVEQAQPIGYEYIRTGINKTTGVDDFSDLNLPEIDNQAGITIRQSNGNKELVAPIRLHNETIGVLGLQDLADDSAEWTADDISLLEEVSSQVALAIENSRLLQQTKEQTNELSILFEATRQLTETIDLQQIFHILTSQTISYLNAERCSVLLLNDARTHFETAVTQGRDEKNNLITLTDVHLVALESSPALQRMIRNPSRVVVHADDAEIEPALKEHLLNKHDTAVQTLARFPLIVRSKLIGLLEVVHFHQPHYYTSNELQLTQAIISQVTVAIENAQLFQQTQSALEDTQKLYNISRKLVESTSVDEIFEIVLDSAKSYNVDRVSISLIDRGPDGSIESTTIVASWDRDPDKQLPVGTRFYTQHFSLVNAFANPPFHPLISNDLTRAHDQDPRMDEAFRQYALKTLEAVTLFSAPMFLGTEYKGVLSIYTRQPHTYSNQEIRLYQTLADQAIIAIENYGLLQTTRQERDRASLLYQLGQALGNTTSVGEVQNVVMSFIPKIGATDGELYITDGTDFVSLASTVMERNKLTPERLATIGLSHSHEALALTTEELVVLAKPDLPPEDWPLAETDNLGNVQTLVCVPFFSQRSTLQGVLSLYHTQPDAFTAEQIAMFESVAIQTAASLENAWLLRQTNIVLHETELLYNITRGFNSAKNTDDLLNVIARNLVDTEIDSMA